MMIIIVPDVTVSRSESESPAASRSDVTDRVPVTGGEPGRLTVSMSDSDSMSDSESDRDSNGTLVAGRRPGAQRIIFESWHVVKFESPSL